MSKQKQRYMVVIGYGIWDNDLLDYVKFINKEEFEEYKDKLRDNNLDLTDEEFSDIYNEIEPMMDTDTGDYIEWDELK